MFTFALGIGVNVAVFTAVDRILLRPPPYHNVEELVYWIVQRERGMSGGFPSLVAFEGRARLTTIEEIAVAGMSRRLSFRRTP